MNTLDKLRQTISEGYSSQRAAHSLALLEQLGKEYANEIDALLSTHRLEVEGLKSENARLRAAINNAVSDQPWSTVTLAGPSWEDHKALQRAYEGLEARLKKIEENDGA